jgi:hypothetical protein
VKPPKGAPTVGRVYRHYKGGLYCVEALARHTEDNVWMVVYREYHGSETIWTRPLAHWLQRTQYEGKWVPRFGETAILCPAHLPQVLGKDGQAG